MEKIINEEFQNVPNSDLFNYSNNRFKLMLVYIVANITWNNNK